MHETDWKEDIKRIVERWLQTDEGLQFEAEVYQIGFEEGWDNAMADPFRLNEPPDEPEDNWWSRMPEGFPLNLYESHKELPDEFAQYPMSHIVAFCAEEVRRQQDTQWHVYRMFDAWSFAREQRALEQTLTHGVVREIGARVDERGEEGYRSYEITMRGNTPHNPTRTANYGDRIGAFPDTIHFKMTALLEKQFDLDPDTWYYEFEKIHPFGDGNGRSGKILYNWLNDSLSNPVWPTDFFSTPGRRIENP